MAVVRNTRADILIDCTYINRHLDSIKPRKRYVELSNGCVATIQRWLASEPCKETIPEGQLLVKRS